MYEFPPGDAEWQLRDLARGLQALAPGLKVDFCNGFLKQYRAGGTSLIRVVNGAFVHTRALFQILFTDHDVVLVRSSPPLIQITVAIAAKLQGIPYWVWLMDAHPEIEQVKWAGIPGLGWLLGRVHHLNICCLKGAEMIVLPDQAMRERFAPLVGEEKIIVCPTWGNNSLQVNNVVPNSTDLPSHLGLRLAYIGNLGFAHDIPNICRFLNECSKRVQVELVFISAAVEAAERVRGGVNSLRVVVTIRPPVPFSGSPGLSAVIRELDFDYGIVSMSDEFAGLLSPSKFIGYLEGDLPIIYLGPPSTNAAQICDRFNAGIRVDLAEQDSHIGRVIDLIVSRDCPTIMRKGIAAALTHFAQYHGGYLAGEILQKGLSLRGLTGIASVKCKDAMGD